MQANTIILLVSKQTPPRTVIFEVSPEVLQSGKDWAQQKAKSEKPKEPNQPKEDSYQNFPNPHPRSKSAPQKSSDQNMKTKKTGAKGTSRGKTCD